MNARICTITVSCENRRLAIRVRLKVLCQSVNSGYNNRDRFETDPSSEDGAFGPNTTLSVIGHAYKQLRCNTWKKSHLNLGIEGPAKQKIEVPTVSSVYR